jgi:hypothetical protein
MEDDSPEHGKKCESLIISGRALDSNGDKLSLAVRRFSSAQGSRQPVVTNVLHGKLVIAVSPARPARDTS